MKEKRDDKQKKKDAIEHFLKEELECKKHEQPTYRCIILSYFFTFASTITQLPQQQKQLKPM